MHVFRILAVILALVTVTGCVIERDGHIRPAHVVLR
jgi:hypothetical protein